jgi:sugar lactone lactonase YvrE
MRTNQGRMARRLLGLMATVLMIWSCQEGNIMVGSQQEKRVGIDDGLAVLEDGWVIGAHWSADRVRLVSPQGQAQELTRFPKPNGVALLLEENKVLILSSSTPKMLVYDIPSREYAIRELDRIYTGIILSPAGELFLSSWGNNLIAHYDFDTMESQVISQHPGFNGPQGMAVDLEGHLYVANFNDGIIFRLDPDEPDEIKEVFEVPGETEMRVGDIHWYGSGLLISALEQRQIWHWSPDDGRVTRIGQEHSGQLDSKDGHAGSAVIDTPNSFL